MAEIDEGCRRRFEADRLSGGAAPLEAFLPDADAPSYRATLEELVLIDLEVRWKRRDGGAPEPSVRDYAARFPGLAEPGILARMDAESAWLRDRYGGAAPRAGLRVGRYVLVAPAGQGAFAAVWRARDEALDRDVALKLPHPALAGDHDAVARVRREARSAARLSHPGIVSVYEVGEHEGRPFFASEFVAGPTLAAWLATARPAPDEAARIVARLAEAVAYAHDCGVVHRDIKPGNVLLDAEGRPKLADFGLARLASGETDLTHHGDVLGTPAYMAPEQALGETAQIGERTDVHALGGILYELLTGEAPYRRESTAATVHAVVHERLRRPRGAPADLATVCLQALAKRPRDRYASARAFAEDLRRYLERRPIEARRAGLPERLWLWAQRQPGTAAAAVTGLVAVFVVAAVGFAGVRAERDLYQAERDRAHEFLFRSLVGEAEALLEAQGANWYPRAIETIRMAAAMGEVADRALLRDLVLRSASVPRLRLDRVARWEPVGGVARALAASRDGRFVAAITDGDVLWVRRVPEGTTQAQVAVSPGARCVALSPDGAEAVLGHEDGTVAVHRADTLEVLAVRAGDGAAVTALASEPGGGAFAVADADGWVAVLALREGRLEVLARQRGHDGGALALAFTDDGTLLVSGGAEGAARVWHWRDGRVLAVSELDAPARVVAAGDGSRFVAGARESFSIGVFTVEDPAFRAAPESPIGGALLAAGMGAGNRTLSLSSDGILVAWSDVARPLVHARIGEGVVRAAAVSSTGDLAVAGHASGRLTLWRPGSVSTVHAWMTTQAGVFLPGTRRLITDRVEIDYDRTPDPATRGYDLVPVVGLGPAAGSTDVLAVSGDGSVHRISLDGGRKEGAGVSTGLSDVVLAVPDADGSVWALATAAGALWRGSFEGERFVGERMAPGLGVVHAMAFGPDGGLLVLCQLGLVGIARDGAVLRHAEHELSRGALAVGPGLVALSAPGGRIELRSPDGARRLRELEGHAQEVVGLALSPDGTTLVSSDGLDVRVWDTRSGRKRGRLHPPAVPSGALAIDPTGRFAVIGAAGALLVDLERMRPFGRLQVGTGRAILLHPDGASLLVGTDRGAVSASSMAEITAAYERSRALDEEGMDVGVPVVHGCSVLLQGGHGTPVWGIAASGDGRWLATGSHGSVVKLWDARSLRLVRDLTSPGSVPAWAQAFSADSTTLAANVGEEIRLFDVPSGTERRRLEPHDGLVLALAFHPRGRTLVSSAAGRQARVWDTEAGTWRPLASGQRVVRALAFSPDEASLVGACSDGAILLWDAAALGPDAEPRLLGLHATGAWAVAYDPASGILASGAEDGEVRLWRTDTGDVLATLRAQPRIRHLSFSSDGTHLAAACYALPSTTWDLAAIRTRLADLGLAWEDAR